MKTILATYMLLSFGISHSQSFSSKLDNYQKGLPEMDFIIIPFDISYRVSLGKLNSDGILEVKIPEFSDVRLPSNLTSDTMLKFEDLITVSCSNGSKLDVSESLRGFRGGYFALWSSTKRNGWAGSVFAVSNKDLIPWLEDDAYMQPVLGSYYELIYVTESAVISNNCHTTWNNGVLEIIQEYQFDLNLKKGYNLIEYEILDLFETNSNTITNKPSKIVVRTPTDFSKIIWTAKYF